MKREDGTTVLQFTITIVISAILIPKREDTLPALAVFLIRNFILKTK